MHITVKCFATLQEHTPTDADDYEISAGQTVADVLEQLGLTDADVHLIFINGRKGEPSSVLHAGDRLGLFPPVGGG